MVGDVMEVYFLEKEWKIFYDKRLESLLKKKEFDGSYGKSTFFLSEKILVLGLGEIRLLDAYRIKQLGGIAGKYAKENKIEKIKFQIKELNKKINFSLGVWLEIGAYYTTHNFSMKSKKDTYVLKHVEFDDGTKTDGKLFAEIINQTRDLINSPSNLKTPIKFTEHIKKLLKKSGGKVSIDILKETELKKIGMDGLVAVGQGSVNKPVMMCVEYGTQFKKNGTFVLVGKGITFDSGGLSLKPPLNMDEMKDDMSGAAVVFGTIAAISKFQIKKHVVAIAGLAENMPDGNALKPGDILKMYNGKTVEVKNTDAEGRIILGDVLAYAEKKYKPKVIVDLATLTGAVVIALGHNCAAVMGNDTKLISKIIEFGQKSGDRCWELPIWEEHESMVESDIADIMNIGTPPRAAGTIVGGVFLKNFIEKTSWAHIDIAGTSYYEQTKPFSNSGATGFGILLLYKLIENL